MIHIVFNEADVTTLQQVIELDETLTGEVLLVRDDFAVGPIQNIFEEQGINARKDWTRSVLAGGDYDGHVDTGLVDDEKLFAELKEKLDANATEQVWIWCAQNKHDVSGYYWLMSRMQLYQGRVYILYLNNLPFINDKGQIFYPKWIHEIRPTEFLKAKKLARTITPSEFEVDPDEWTKLASENKHIRLLEGGKKLIQEEVDYYDNDLKSFVGTEFQKVNKLINTYLTKGKYQTGDMFLLWRIKEMIAEGKLEAQGNVAKMKDFEVKLKAVAAVAEN